MACERPAIVCRLGGIGPRPTVAALPIRPDAVSCCDERFSASGTARAPSPPVDGEALSPRVQFADQRHSSSLVRSILLVCRRQGTVRFASTTRCPENHTGGLPGHVVPFSKNGVPWRRGGVVPPGCPQAPVPPCSPRGVAMGLASYGNVDVRLCPR